MNIHTPSTNFASFAVLVGASIWGVYWIPLRYMEDMGISGAWPVALLNIAPVLVFAIWSLSNWQKHSRHLTAAFYIGLLTGLAFALYGIGLIYTSVMRATLLFYLTPVWATIIGILWLDERASWQRVTAIIGGLVGLSILVSGGTSIALNVGDLYALMSGIFWAFGAAMIKRLPEVPVPTMAGMQSFFVGAGAIGFGYLAGNQSMITLAQLQQALPVAAGVSLLLIVPGAMVLVWAQKFLSPGRVGLLMMSEVLVAAISAQWLLPEERMNMWEWLGALLIVGACVLEIMFTPLERAHPPNH